MATGSEDLAAGPPRDHRVPLLAAAVMVLVVVIALLLVFRGNGSGSKGASGATPTSTPSPSSSASPSVNDIYQQVGPSVAVVRTAKGALGTGVIATTTGAVLTANHVIADGSAITIIFADGTKSAATVASADPTTDIATLTPATLPQPVVPGHASAAAPTVGGAVVAIGNPLGLTYSVSVRRRVGAEPHRRRPPAASSPA